MGETLSTVRLLVAVRWRVDAGAVPLLCDVPKRRTYNPKISICTAILIPKCKYDHDYYQCAE